MASIALIIGVIGEVRTLEASGKASEIKDQFRDLRDSGNPGGFDKIEVWDKDTGLTRAHDFGKAIRRAAAESIQEEVEQSESDEGLTKDELKAALTERGVDFDARLGKERLQALYDESTPPE